MQQIENIFIVLTVVTNTLFTGFDKMWSSCKWLKEALSSLINEPFFFFKEVNT